jgi:hypothetical protein
MIFHAPPHFQEIWTDTAMTPLRTLASGRDQVEFFIRIIVYAIIFKDYELHQIPPFIR